MSLVCDHGSSWQRGNSGSSKVTHSRVEGAGKWQSLEASPNSNMKLAALRYVPQSSLEVYQSDSYSVDEFLLFGRKSGDRPFWKLTLLLALEWIGDWGGRMNADVINGSLWNGCQNFSFIVTLAMQCYSSTAIKRLSLFLLCLMGNLKVWSLTGINQ